MMTSLEALTASLAKQPSVEASVEFLVNDLAERIRTTSNDQNIQKLARDLKAKTPDLVGLIAGKAHQG